MTTIVSPAGLVNLLAPLPSPPQFNLLAAANLVDPTTARWLGGAWTGGDVPGPAHTHDPCSTGTERVKASAGTIATSMSGRFTVYQPAFCTAQSIGPDPTYWTDRLELVFQTYEGAAVARVLATGDGHATLGPYLGDTNMEVLGSGAQNALRALELLQEAVLAHGGGLIHAAPATATAWISAYVAEPARGILYTKLGTPIAVDYGYVGAVPSGQSNPASDQQWAFASGPINIYRDNDISLIPLNYAQAIDRSVNDVMFYAERPYLLSWIARQDSNDEDHTQAGVLIDLVP